MSPADRSKLPPLGEDPPLRLPPIQTHVLANGLRVRSVRHGQMPVATFQLVLSVGSAVDPQGREGLAALTADLLDEGAGHRSMVELHEALARIGAHVDLEVGPDGVTIGLTTLARHAEKGLTLLADMVVRPRFDPAEFDRVRELRLNRLRQLRDVAAVVADRAFARALFGSHPYGHAPLGTEAALLAVTRDEAVAFHADCWQPSLTTLLAVGDVDHPRLATLADQAFGEWGALAPRRYAIPELRPAALPSRRHEEAEMAPILVHRAGAPQSEIRVGRIGAARTSPRFHALLVLNMILGGQFVSRINLNLREDKGYTYGARSLFDFRRVPGPFVVQAGVQTDATGASIREVLRELHDMATDRPPTAAELDGARAALTRGYPRGFETAAQVARGFAQLALYGMPDDELAEFVPRVAAIDHAALDAAAAEHLDASPFLVVVVGDRDRVAGQLSRTPVEVAPDA